jgi:nucleotide-binding universal stress UspA family protein
MKSILCPTDFSDVSHNAIVFAAKLSKKFGATLHLANIQRVADRTPEEAIMGRDANVQAASESLDALCQEVSKVFRISCDGHATSSALSVSGELAAHLTDYDLVVIGTNGEDEFSQRFLGSNTYQMINKSTIPVLAIPDGCSYTEIKTIVYALDYWRNDQLILAEAVSFAEKLGARLQILQVMEASVSSKADSEIKQLQNMILGIYGDRVHVSFAVVHSDDVSEAINDHFVREKADVLALHTPHHSFPAALFHKSIVRAITNAARYPVLVFPG